MIKLKRAYEKPQKNDGMRILVDRVWPRGVSKETLKLHAWMKEIAPSTQLRKWFGHDPEKWAEFKKKYRAELKSQAKEIKELRALSKAHTITLVYGAKDEAHNQAVVLKEILSR
ncbi:MAG TPA: DUF488 domain-containing protein [Candidatus Paceibacterota bacterium]|nr:DUF488 domain-containing protein [Candidatus Paceibacterota bacterium]